MNENETDQAYIWSKASERFSIHAFHNRMDVLVWNAIADDLANALNLLIDSPASQQAMIVAQNALEKYNERSKVPNYHDTIKTDFVAEKDYQSRTLDRYIRGLGTDSEK